MRQYVVCKSCGRIFAPKNYDTKQRFCTQSCAHKGGARHIPSPTVNQRPQLSRANEPRVAPVTPAELSEALQCYFARGGQVTYLPSANTMVGPVDAQPHPDALFGDLMSRLEQQEQDSTLFPSVAQHVVPGVDRELVGVIQEFRSQFGG